MRAPTLESAGSGTCAPNSAWCVIRDSNGERDGLPKLNVERDCLPFVVLGHSIYGATFADENFIVKHSGRGVIAMVRYIRAAVRGGVSAKCVFLLLPCRLPMRGVSDSAHVVGRCVPQANSDLHTNASQFLVSFRALGWMDEKYVAFGQLVEGSATLKAIEEAETSSSGRPTRDIVIADCGEYVA